jgi:hypothetical protein
MSWFRKTTVYTYSELVPELRNVLHQLIDTGIRSAWQRSEDPEYTFRFYASTSCALDRNSYVNDIPVELYYQSIERIVGDTRLYCIFPTGDPGFWYTVCFIHGRIQVRTTEPAVVPLTSRLARAAVRLAEESNDICPITLEPVASLTALAVGHCGHVCGEEAVSLQHCPMCRIRCAWTLYLRDGGRVGGETSA